jgi:hypothetical protein
MSKMHKLLHGRNWTQNKYDRLFGVMKVKGKPIPVRSLGGPQGQDSHMLYIIGSQTEVGLSDALYHPDDC